eukprot:Pgem_evm1s17940
MTVFNFFLISIAYGALFIYTYRSIHGADDFPYLLLSNVSFFSKVDDSTLPTRQNIVSNFNINSNDAK